MPLTVRQLDIVSNGLSIIIQWVKEAKVMFDNEKERLCSNNISLGTKMKLKGVFVVLLCVDQKQGPYGI